MKVMKRLLPFSLALALLLTGCAQSGGVVSPDVDADDVYIDRVELEEIIIEDEEVALAGAPAALDKMLMPEASGKQVKENNRAVIDYSNVSDGYVMVKFTGTTRTRLKVQVSCPTPKLVYTYDLPVGEWTTFPLPDGSGKYVVTVLENTTASKYAQVLSVSFDVKLTNEFAPFLRPNQFVDYSTAPKTIAKAAELAGSETDPLKLVEVIYQYVVSTLTYDKKLAASITSGTTKTYLPDLDSVLAAKKGICFDYASLMTGMLRSLGVPCKLVTGYVPVGGGKTAYHAWISVYSDETGWVEGTVYFDGHAWQRMDPTFASSGKGSSSIMKFIGDGSNYSVKLIY